MSDKTYCAICYLIFHGKSVKNTTSGGCSLTTHLLEQGARNQPQMKNYETDRQKTITRLTREHTLLTIKKDGRRVPLSIVYGFTFISQLIEWLYRLFLED